MPISSAFKSFTFPSVKINISLLDWPLLNFRMVWFKRMKDREMGEGRLKSTISWPLKSTHLNSGYLIFNTESAFLKVLSKSLVNESGKSTTKIYSNGSFESLFLKILKGKIATSKEAKIRPLILPKSILHETD